MIYKSLTGNGRAPESCTHDNDVGVFCVEENYTECSSGSVKLVNASGNTGNEGRVEMCIADQWGTICDDSWSEAATAVTCGQMGKISEYMPHQMCFFMLTCIGIMCMYTYCPQNDVQCDNGSGGGTVNAADYGVASVPILFDDVKCTGSESNLLSCPQMPFNSIHDCTHKEDVAVMCRGML